jgi:hypothetical protein
MIDVHLMKTVPPHGAFRIDLRPFPHVPLLSNRRKKLSAGLCPDDCARGPSLNLEPLWILRFCSALLFFLP